MPREKKEKKPAQLPRDVLIKASQDVGYFSERFLKVLSKDTGLLVPVRAYAEQRELWNKMRQGSVVVLKGRQIGISTATLLYLFHAWIWNQGPASYAIIGYSSQTVKAQLRQILTWYEQLPEQIREARPLITNSANELRITRKEGESSFYAYTADGKGARSTTLGGAMITEFAFFQDQEKTLNATLPTLSEGAPLVIETTPKQSGDYYHALVMRASRGEGSFQLLFFPWFTHKRYTREGVITDLTQGEQELLSLGASMGNLVWRREQIGGILDARMFRKEYPSTIKEAFQADSQGPYADYGDRITSLPGVGQEITYQKPGKSKYIATIDAGLGTGGDYTVMLIMDCVTGDPCYLLRSNTMSTTYFSDRAIGALTRYGFGTGALYVLCEENYPGNAIYEKLIQIDAAHTIPWTTTSRSKSDAHGKFSMCVEAGVIHTLPESCVEEIVSLTVPHGKISPEAPQGAHDDHAMVSVLYSAALSLVPKTHTLPSWEEQPGRVESYLAQKARRGKVGSW